MLKQIFLLRAKQSKLDTEQARASFTKRGHLLEINNSENDFMVLPFCHF